MKKISKYFLMASVFLTVNVPMAFADASSVCALVGKLSGVIATLRTLAFVGAAFVLMDWAWGYIKDPSKATKDDMKDKGIGMFVGFFILFGVGLILQFVGSEGGQSYLGCVSKAFSAGLE
jgi:hypothetical protein